MDVRVFLGFLGSGWMLGCCQGVTLVFWVDVEV